LFIGIRNRKLNKISQINLLIKEKLESKIAKTTGLLTAAFMSSFIPIFIFGILGNAIPVIRTNAAFQFTQKFPQLKSLLNPLLYCYRDKRFRKAIRELLGLKKHQTIQSATSNPKFSWRKYSIRSLKLSKLENRTKRLKRSLSCTPPDALYSVYGTPNVFMLKKSLSAPTLNACSSYLDALHLQRVTSTVDTSATTRAERGV